MNKKIMVIPVGLPRAGKSTLGKQLTDLGYVSVSRDTIREELHGHKANMSTEDEVTKIYDARLQSAIDKGMNVYIDNTNLKLKYRNRFISIGKKNGYHIKYVVFYVEMSVLKQRAEATNFPFDVIVRMLKSMDIVDFKIDEKYDEIEYVTGTTRSAYEYIAELDDYNQNSKFHNLSLGGHMRSAQEYAMLNNFSMPVVIASAFHDLGKPYVRVINEDGTWSYPGHATPSAYQMLSILLNKGDNDLIFASAFLASKHMDRFQEFGSKYVKSTSLRLVRFGLTWEELERTWEADIKAH